MLCSMRGYACVIITSSKCSKEKMDSIRAYGATLIIAEPGQNYMQIETDMAKANPSWFSVNQVDPSLLFPITFCLASVRSR